MSCLTRPQQEAATKALSGFIMDDLLKKERASVVFKFSRPGAYSRRALSGKKTMVEMENFAKMT